MHSSTPAPSTVRNILSSAGRSPRFLSSRRGGKPYWPTKTTRSEEHTSELQSLMRISYAVFCLKKKKKRNSPTRQIRTKHKINHKIRNTMIQKNTHNNKK